MSSNSSFSPAIEVIIRLQNLPLTAKASHIRDFFHELHIPKGAVNIAGGTRGDAFIGFTSNEDARLAMRLDGHLLQGVPARLLLSSRQEMDAIIAEAKACKKEQAGEKMNPSSRATAVSTSGSSPRPSADQLLRDCIREIELRKAGRTPNGGSDNDTKLVKPSAEKAGFAVPPPPFPSNLHELANKFAPAQQQLPTDSWKTAAAVPNPLTVMGICGRPDPQWTNAAHNGGSSLESLQQNPSQNHQYQQHFLGGGTPMERPSSLPPARHHQPMITQTFFSPLVPPPPSIQGACSLSFLQGSPPAHHIQQQHQHSQQFPNLSVPPPRIMFPMVKQVSLSAGTRWSGGTSHSQQLQVVPTVRIGFPSSSQQQLHGGKASTFQQYGQSRRGVNGPYQHPRSASIGGGGYGNPRGMKHPFQQRQSQHLHLHKDGAPGMRRGPPGGWSRGDGGVGGDQQALGNSPRQRDSSSSFGGRREGGRGGRGGGGKRDGGIDCHIE